MAKIEISIDYLLKHGSSRMKRLIEWHLFISDQGNFDELERELNLNNIDTEDCNDEE